MTYADDLGATRVVFEQDDSLWRWDTQRLVEITRAVGCRAALQVWAPPRRRREVTRFARRDRLVGGVSGENKLGERHWLKRCRRVYRIRSFAIDHWQDTRRRAGSSDRSPAVSTVGRGGTAPLQGPQPGGEDHEGERFGQVVIRVDADWRGSSSTSSTFIAAPTRFG